MTKSELQIGFIEQEAELYAFYAGFVATIAMFVAWVILDDIVLAYQFPIVIICTILLAYFIMRRFLETSNLKPLGRNAATAFLLTVSTTFVSGFLVMLFSGLTVFEVYLAILLAGSLFSVPAGIFGFLSYSLFQYCLLKDRNDYWR